MAYQRVKVLTNAERRRSYTPAEKARMVEEAVAAYRAALEEMTRERVPLDWG